MDSPLWILRMASDRIMLISTVLILGHWSFCISCGIVFVTTTYRKKKWSGRCSCFVFHFLYWKGEREFYRSHKTTLADKTTLYITARVTVSGRAMCCHRFHVSMDTSGTVPPSFHSATQIQRRYRNIPPTEEKGVLTLTAQHLTTSHISHCYS